MGPFIVEPPIIWPWPIIGPGVPLAPIIVVCPLPRLVTATMATTARAMTATTARTATAAVTVFRPGDGDFEPADRGLAGLQSGRRLRGARRGARGQGDDGDGQHRYERPRRRHAA